MPRIRQDNDARYALRASFTDQFGNVIEGDTIVIETPGLGSVFGVYKWSNKEDSTDDKKVSIDSQSDYTLCTKLFISKKTDNDVQAANLMDAYLTENTVVYIQKITALSDANTSNWVLSNAPDAYLYGALIHSAPFLRDDERIGVWAALYQSAIDGLNRASGEARHGATGLRMR